MIFLLNHLCLLIIFLHHHLSSSQIVHLNRNNLFATCWSNCNNQSQVILLYSKNISTIDVDTFIGLSRLEELQLQYNLLRSIRKHTFEDASLLNLKRLFLDNNQIDFLHSTTFDSLLGLEVLGLSNNNLNQIDSFTFKSLKNVWRLTLSHNNLSSIDSSTLNGLTNVISLDISYNRIEKIDLNEKQFESNKLTYLYANNNCLFSLDANTFRGLLNLQWLEFQNNKMKSIDKETFANVNTLQYLRLDSNELNGLGFFEGLDNLLALYLDENNLSMIDSSSFKGIVKLKHLSLESNFIYIFGNDSLSQLDELVTVCLWNNPVVHFNPDSLKNICKCQIYFKEKC